MASNRIIQSRAIISFLSLAIMIFPALSQKLLVEDLYTSFDGWKFVSNSGDVGTVQCQNQLVLNVERHTVQKLYALERSVKKVEIDIEFLVIDYATGQNRIEIYVDSEQVYSVGSETFDNVPKEYLCGSSVADRRKTIYFTHIFPQHKTSFTLKIVTKLEIPGSLGLRNLRIYDDTNGFPIIPIFSAVAGILIFTMIYFACKYRKTKNFDRLNSDRANKAPGSANKYRGTEKPSVSSDKKPMVGNEMVVITNPDDLKPQDLQDILKNIQDELDDDENNYHNRA